MGNQQPNLIELPLNEKHKYFVSEEGKVFSKKPSGLRELKQHKHLGRSNSPYLRLRVGSKKYLTHRLMMAASIGRLLTDSEQVNHINGITTDNRMCNLEIVTHAENVKHAVENNLYSSGEAWHKARQS